MPSIRPRILESTVTRRILDWLKKQPDCFAYKVHGHPGQMTGIPDISCVYRGLSVWIEVKSPDNKAGPTLVQLHRMEQIEAAGGFVFQARSLTTVKEEFAQLDAIIESRKVRRSKSSKGNHGAPVT